MSDFLKMFKFKLFIIPMVFSYSISFAEVGFLDQKLDPKNKNDNRIFSQKYEIDASLAKDKSAPVFYVLGSEGSMEEGSLSQMQIAEFAKKLPNGAFLVQVEHRYYGVSVPFADLSAENLKYSDPDRALSDYAELQKYLSEKYKLVGPWIVVGASYGGELALTYRLKFPSLTVGALAYSDSFLESADLIYSGKFDAGKRDSFVSKSLPPDCLAKISSAVSDLERKYDENRLGPVKAIVKLQDVGDLDFLAALGDVTITSNLYAAQDRLCEAINKQDSIANDVSLQYVLAVEDYLKNTLRSTFAEQTFSIGGRIRSASHPANSGYFGNRQFAYYQCVQVNQPYVEASEDRKFSVIARQVNRSYQDSFCREEFGVRRPYQNLKRGNHILNQLQSKKIDGVAFINGKLDQWEPLSITKNTEIMNQLGPGNLVVLLENGFHCPTYVKIEDAATEEEKQAIDMLFVFIEKLTKK